jgi:hypothetical protein
LVDRLSRDIDSREPASVTRMGWGIGKGEVSSAEKEK